MAELEIRDIPSKEEVIENWGYLRRVPTNLITQADLLQGCLDGRFIMLEFYKDDSFEGLAVVQYLPPDSLLILALHLPELVREFDETLLQWCRDHKIKRYLATSKRNPEAYSRLMRMQIDSTTFIREVE